MLPSHTRQLTFLVKQCFEPASRTHRELELTSHVPGPAAPISGSEFRSSTVIMATWRPKFHRLTRKAQEVP
eukprot:767501-Hanusia_phi.AAC.2